MDRTKPRLLSALLLALTLTACGGGGEGGDEGSTPPSSTKDSPQSVILFTVDTLRADRLGCYGDPRGQTPNIDILASEGLLFLNPYTQASHTHAAMSSMLTGLYPHHSGVLGMSGTLADGVECVAEGVRRLGIPTGSFASSHCTPGKVDGTVWHDGWDVVFCIREDGTEHWDWDRRVVNEAMRWMAAQDGPFFCWIHLIDPHGEHIPPPKHWEDGEGFWDRDEQNDLFQGYANAAAFPTEEELDLLNRLYDAEVKGVDDQLGRVQRFLDKQGWTDDTAIIFSADHGEELFQTAPRWGHGRVLTEAVLRVPLIAKVPGVSPAVITDPVETLQVTPTIHEIFNVPQKRRPDSPSLLHETPSRGYAISYYGNTVTIRNQDVRGWMTSEGLPKDPMMPLYAEVEERSPVPWFGAPSVAARFEDTAEPYAPTYLAESDLKTPELNEKIWKPLAGHLETLKPVTNLHEQAIEGDFRAELEAMGYLGDE